MTLELSPRTQAYISSLTCTPLEADDPRIEACVQHYINQFELPKDSRPVAERWFGVFDGEQLLVAVGERMRAPGVVEVTDMYPSPPGGPRSTAAIYGALQTYRKLMQLGVYKNVLAAVLSYNETFQRVIERVFGLRPTAYFYIANGEDFMEKA